jgi:hemoglobin
MTTIFDKYGGISTFNRLTAIFYQKLLDSPQVSHYFEGINMKLLAEHQSNFLASAMGGPNIYEGRDIKAAHANLNITNEDFAEVILVLEETLEQMNVDSDDIITIVKTVVPFKRDIVHG